MSEGRHDPARRPDLASDVVGLLQGSIALVGIYDPGEVLRFANAAFRAAYFIGPDEEIDWQTLMRRNFAAGRGTRIETDDIESWISSVRSRRGKSRERTYESDLHGGRFIWVTETRRDDGWITYVGTDITQLNVSERQLRLANDRLFRQSYTDELTGVSNRRHILGKLQEAVDAGQETWACVLDIDHFKRINDSFGHQAGDDVLVGFARTARRTVHLADAFGRVGGEEFVIVFGGQPLDEATRTLRRLRDAMATLDAAADHPGLPITVSGGLTHVSPGDTLTRILQRADRGLYAAKQAGRNRICIARSDDPSVEPAVIVGDTN